MDIKKKSEKGQKESSTNTLPKENLPILKRILNKVLES
jgi:hypothetical protein